MQHQAKEGVQWAVSTSCNAQEAELNNDGGHAVAARVHAPSRQRC